MQIQYIGWDVGGAHLKAALVDGNGQVKEVLQFPCPLWKGLDYLQRAIQQVIAHTGDGTYQHVITMTGELVDLFDNREHGVNSIIHTIAQSLEPGSIYIYAGTGGFLSIDQVKQQHYIAISSANWLASASLVAQKAKNGLFIDIGSTTTDILLLADYQVKVQGFTDYERLQSGELLYTGIVRTAVMAVTQSVYFKGRVTGLMAEYFATMADVYRLTGELKESDDQTETADGAEKTRSASARRLSRMIGYDYVESDLVLWQQFAQALKSKQLHNIQQACECQLSRFLVPMDSVLVGAGVGRFLVKQIAYNLNYPYVDFDDLLFSVQCKKTTRDFASCAPAIAVVLLYLQDGLNSDLTEIKKGL